MSLYDKPVAVGSATIWGVDAVPVTIEATLRGTSGPPKILGHVDPVIREAYHRILSAFRAEGIESPRGAPTINFVPAHVRKTGSGFDLPMALALAGAAGVFPPERTHGLTALGEISLDGTVLAVRGAVSVALAAVERGWTRMLAAPQDAAAAALVPHVRVHAVHRLRDALLWLRGELDLPPASAAPAAAPPTSLDLADIRGHETPKTALVAAAAGRHNVLLVGPPGSGKTALMRRLVGLLPPPSERESLEILKVHTAHGAPGRLPYGIRPVRAPHHSSSHVSLLGGGPDPRPGEVTLAHHGVLFLDELAEFRREALEGLRQPLEDGSIVIGRALRTAVMPADFLLVAAMNPCPCGYFGHRSRPCICTTAQRRRYAARISGPLLDRFDLQVEVPALEPQELARPADRTWSTEPLRARVLAALERQAQRHRDEETFTPNGRLADRRLELAVGNDRALHETLDEILRTHQLSGRARVRLLRIARTLADLKSRDEVLREDVLSAARLRGLEKSWAAHR